VEDGLLLVLPLGIVGGGEIVVASWVGVEVGGGS